MLQDKGVARTRIHKLFKPKYLSTDIVSQVFALRRLAQITSEIQIKNARPPAWEPPKLLLVLVKGGLDVVVSTSEVLLLLSSKVDCSGRSGKKKGGIKQR